jgi:uncharacterized membrane protein YsdA (DUF1294 family)
VTQRNLTLVFLVYLVASFITFIVYALDKSAAKRGARRTPEVTLHFLSLVGGWPGAVLAQGLFRHKTMKHPFRLVFWLTVAVNLAGLALMLQ